MRKLKDVKDAQNSTRLKAHILPFNSPQNGKTRIENLYGDLKWGFGDYVWLTGQGPIHYLVTSEKLLQQEIIQEIKKSNNFNGKPSRGWRAVGERQKHGW